LNCFSLDHTCSQAHVVNECGYIDNDEKYCLIFSQLHYHQCETTVLRYNYFFKHMHNQKKNKIKKTELRCLVKTQRYQTFAHESQQWWQYFLYLFIHSCSTLRKKGSIYVA